MYDIIIAGGGPAGLTAALYACRAGLSALVIEEMASGGQVAETAEIDNYPGIPNIQGYALAMQMETHAKSAGAEFAYEKIESFELAGEIKKVKTAKKEYESKTVVLAMGTQRRKLKAPGEDTLKGRGVSYCATCDGNFFRNKPVAVVGGGNTALGDALYLANICSNVFLIHRRDSFRATVALQNQVEASPKITTVFDSTVERIEGDEKVTGLALKNSKTGASSSLEVSAVFIAAGMTPRTGLLGDAVPLSDGFVVATETGETKVPGVFAAGDIREKELRQIITAASDGANAAMAAQAYLQTRKL